MEERNEDDDFEEYLMKMLDDKFDGLKKETVPKINNLYNMFDDLDNATEKNLCKLSKDVENATKLRKADKTDHMMQFNVINKQLTTQNENIESMAEALSNVGELSACIFEAHKISTAMESQDEEDR